MKKFIKCGILVMLIGGKMEKVKDFLYDISDLFFSLLIIGIIFFVVSWKLTDTMSVSWFSNIDRDPIEETEVVEVTTPNLEEEVTVTDPVEEVTEPVEEVTEPVEEIVEVRDVTFEVAPGSSGYKIAVQLQEEGLITDVDEFIQTLGDLKLGNKLRAGTFKLNTGMTVEEIIKKLAGQ